MWTSTFRMEIEVLFSEPSWQMSIYCLIPWNIVYINIGGCGDGNHWGEKHVLCKHYGSVTFTSSLLESIGTISWGRVLKEIFHLPFPGKIVKSLLSGVQPSDLGQGFILAALFLFPCISDGHLMCKGSNCSFFI